MIVGLPSLCSFVSFQLEPMRSPKTSRILGFEVLQTGDPYWRSVRYGSRVFVQGALESELATVWDNIYQARGKGRPRGTAVRRPS